MPAYPQPLAPDEEAQLIARCADGDEAAWGRLYRIYAPVVLRFLARSTRSEADLDDLVQQVFVNVFSSIGKFRGDARLTSWLYRIAACTVANSHRSNTRRHRRHDAYRTHTESLSGDSGDVHSQVAARRTLHALDGVLDELSPKLRVVWVMVELEGLTPDEVSKSLQIRPGTVRSRLHKARSHVSVRLGALEHRGSSASRRALAGEGGL